jgi:uncharacterized protein YecE (DUF72 family)
MVRIGTAGWAVPRDVRDAFGGGGSLLARYATRFSATEINSSFHRPHRRSTYERWAAETPAAFRFAAKIPKRITHELRLRSVAPELDRFMEEVSGLGDKLAVLLVQLPPKAELELAVARRFFTMLRRRFAGGIACEPRHASWFTPRAEAMFAELRIARVAADPPRGTGETAPGGWRGLVYYRLHGAPRVYWSAYDAPALDSVASALTAASASGAEAWCIFDNTASGAAARNALELTDHMDRIASPPRAATRGAA